MLRKKRRARASVGLSDDIGTDEADEATPTPAETVVEIEESDSDELRGRYRREWRKEGGGGESIGSLSERSNRWEEKGRKGAWSDEQDEQDSEEAEEERRREEEERWQQQQQQKRREEEEGRRHRRERRRTNSSNLHTTAWGSEEEEDEEEDARRNWQVGSSDSQERRNLNRRIQEDDEEEEDEVDEEEERRRQQLLHSPPRPRSLHGSSSRLYHLQQERDEQSSLEREERRMLIPADVTDEEFPPVIILRTPQQRHLRPRVLSHEKEFFLDHHDDDNHKNRDNHNDDHDDDHDNHDDDHDNNDDDHDNDEEKTINGRAEWRSPVKAEEEEAREVSMDDGDVADREVSMDEGSPSWRRKRETRGHHPGSGYERDSGSEDGGSKLRIIDVMETPSEEVLSRRERELYNSSSEEEVEEKHSPFIRPQEVEEEEEEEQPVAEPMLETLLDFISSSDHDVNLRRLPAVESQDMTSDAKGEHVTKTRHRNDALIHPRTLHSVKKRKGRHQRLHDIRPITRDNKALALRRGHGRKPASSDENPFLARISGICRCNEYDLKAAMRALQSQTTFPLYQVRQYPDVIAMKHRQINRCIFILAFGVVVFFNIQKENEGMFISVFRAFEVDPLREVYKDDELEYCSSVSGRFEITNNVVHLQTETLAEKMAVAFALAQCVKLMEFEGRIEKVIESNKHLAEAMSQYGGIRLSSHAITKKLGEIYNERSTVNLYFDLMDTPSYFWEDDTYLPLYQRLVQYLELASRLGVLNKRLDILSELLRMVSGHLHTSHKSRLEWILIWVIGFHVFFGVFWQIFSDDPSQQTQVMGHSILG